MTTITPLSWEPLPGLAHELALGADGSAWCLGLGETSPAGYSIHRWNGRDWDHVDGAAVRIAIAPDGEPAIIDREHQILRWQGSSWEMVPGRAREIALGADGSGWCLSSAGFASGGSSIHIWNGHDWDHVDGAAVKIAVAPDGLPWIVNAVGQIFRRTGNEWELLPGLANEIAVGADGRAWCLAAGAMPSGGGFSIHCWNGFDWDQIPGAAMKIAAGPDGVIWIINSDHAIFRSVNLSAR